MIVILLKVISNQIWSVIPKNLSFLENNKITESIRNEYTINYCNTSESHFEQNLVSHSDDETELSIEESCHFW